MQLAPRQWALVAAAVAVAALGLIAVHEEERASQCELFAVRLLRLDLANSSDTAAQAWDDIYTLNEYGDQRTRLLRDMHEAGCPPA